MIIPLGRELRTWRRHGDLEARGECSKLRRVTEEVKAKTRREKTHNEKLKDSGDVQARAMYQKATTSVEMLGLKAKLSDILLGFI